MIRAVLGIDPGDRFGLAVVTVAAEPKLIYQHGDSLRNKRAYLPTQYVRAVDDVIKAGGGIKLHSAVIEDQYLPRDGDEKRNVRGLKAICRHAGRWEEACKAQGLEVDFVMPAKWQHKILRGFLPPGGHPTRAQRKDAAQRFVKLAWRRDLPPDICDAACMARYAATTLFYGDPRRLRLETE